MVLSKKERYLVIVAAVVVVGFCLFHYAVDPLLDTLADTDQNKSSLRAQMNQDANALKSAQNQAPRWSEMLRSGIKDDPFDAHSQVVQAIHNWASESGVTLQMVKADHQPLARDAYLGEIAIQTAGTGTMLAISQMIWRMQYAAMIPLRITKITLVSRKSAADDLSFNLWFSTIYLPGGKHPAAQTGPASSTAGGGR